MLGWPLGELIVAGAGVGIAAVALGLLVLVARQLDDGGDRAAADPADLSSS